MKIEILVSGRLKNGPLLDVIQSYKKRMSWSVELYEFQSKHKQAASIQKDETAFYLGKISPQAFVIAMDERGKNIGSVDLAEKIGEIQSSGCSHIQCIIGGADGLDEQVRRRADLLLSFGKLTWPHMLARTMLYEQLYRCQQILAGHPYHRE